MTGCAPKFSSLLLPFLFVCAVQAHEARPGYLEIRQTTTESYQVLWRVPAVGDLRLSIKPRFPDRCKPAGDATGFFTADSYTERSTISCAGGLNGRRISFDGLQATLTDVLVRASFLDGAHWTAVARSSQPWINFTGSKSFWEVAQTYVLHGIQHILFGADHLLFVLGLLLIVKNRWMLLKTITAFTVAHSITLAIATLGYANAPTLPLNAAIALSILFLGPEIVRVWRGESSFTIRHPWVVAFAFGLLHGFGFASALTSAGLPSNELPWALLSFNVGVEIGQVGFVILILLLERAFRVLEIRWPRMVEALPGYTVGSLGAFWTIQRVAILLGVAR
jgi:hydrogenase/urease accessory protein HupE